MQFNLFNGNSLDVLKTFSENSVDAIVTDPPYELTSGKNSKKGFMGKEWDGSGIAYNVELWGECLRVLKPGGHLLAFGGTRTYHRMACAIENAGFEVRDMLEWIYASGFPKSLDVGKAYDKLQGNEREHLGTQDRAGRSSGIMGKEVQITRELSKGSSPYEGLGTSLKPAHEPICMARKPLSEKTIVENVIKHGTGAIEIDGCRIPTSEDLSNLKPFGGMPENRYNGKGFSRPWMQDKSKIIEKQQVAIDKMQASGRFPANVLCTDDALNDGEITKSHAGVKNLKTSNIYGGNSLLSSATKGTGEISGHNDEGSKSRYFDIDSWGEKNGLLEHFKTTNEEGSLPAHEPICMARKPLSEKTIVENVIKHGTGAIEIDGCRIPTSEISKELGTKRTENKNGVFKSFDMGERRSGSGASSEQGRFPANVLCTDDALNDGVMTKSIIANRKPRKGNEMWGNGLGGTEKPQPCDSGSKSRFFDINAWGEKHGLLQYPKASKKDRNEGCESLEEKNCSKMSGGHFSNQEDTSTSNKSRTSSNHHPTVKPTHLMAYLVRLVCREGQTVLDPFMGSGSTGKACMLEGRNFIGIELSEEYLAIAKARIEHAQSLASRKQLKLDV